MVNSYLITCIRKTNRLDPHERIHGIGGRDAAGVPWYFTINAAIMRIELGDLEFYTHAEGKSARVIIATHKEHKYLKTEADGVHPNNLLALEECPESYCKAT